jgi:hypothetical protein
MNQEAYSSWYSTLELLLRFETIQPPLMPLDSVQSIISPSIRFRIRKSSTALEYASWSSRTFPRILNRLWILPSVDPDFQVVLRLQGIPPYSSIYLQTRSRKANSPSMRFLFPKTYLEEGSDLSSGLPHLTVLRLQAFSTSWRLILPSSYRSCFIPNPSMGFLLSEVSPF